MVRWPGVIKPGTIIDESVLGRGLAADAGRRGRRRRRIKDKLLKGYQAGGKTFKVHLDGYNQCPYLKGEQTKSPRKEFVYFDDDGNLVAFRDERYKYIFTAQFANGVEVWRKPLTSLRAPIMIDLLTDPFENSFDNAPTGTSGRSTTPS